MGAHIPSTAGLLQTLMLKDPRCPVASGGDSETGKYHDQPVRAGKRRNSLGRSKDDANHAGSGSCSIRRELACGESFYARGLQGEGGTVVNLSGVVSSKPASSTDSVDLAGRAEAMALGGLGADTPLMPVNVLADRRVRNREGFGLFGANQCRRGLSAWISSCNGHDPFLLPRVDKGLRSRPPSHSRLAGLYLSGCPVRTRAGK